MVININCKKSHYHKTPALSSQLENKETFHSAQILKLLSTPLYMNKRSLMHDK